MYNRSIVIKKERLNIKIRKALFLSLWVNSLIVWLYVASRIVVNNVCPHNLFIDSVPFFSFTVVGIIAFVTSMVSMFLFLLESESLSVR